jgi:hypothetical protein
MKYRVICHVLQRDPVELYPAADRLTDAANQYHLWASRDPAFRFPFGFPEGMVSDSFGGGSGQRPIEGRTP